MGTDTVSALEVVNRVWRRRAVVFLISDFETGGGLAAGRVALRRAARQTNRRHDLIAVQIEDARERELPNVGIVALEDAETGEIVELDTARASNRQRFKQLSSERSRGLRDDLRAEGVDTVQLLTDEQYIPALRSFFQMRARAPVRARARV